MSDDPTDPLMRALAGPSASDWASGHEEGRRWTHSGASPEQIVRVAAIYDTPGDRAPPGGWIALAAAVSGNSSPDPVEVRETMTALFGVEEPGASRILGYLEGVRVMHLDAAARQHLLWRRGVQGT